MLHLQHGYKSKAHSATAANRSLHWHLAVEAIGHFSQALVSSKHSMVVTATPVSADCTRR